MNSRVSRRKEILKKIRAEINAKEAKETIEKINKTKSWFFEKVNKIDKPLTRLIKKQMEKNQINRISIQHVEITIDNRNRKDPKRLLTETICQENGQLGRNGHILRKV